MIPMFTEDLARPLYRDPSVLCHWPLPSLPPSDPYTRDIRPAYHSVMTKMQYAADQQDTFLVLHAHAPVQIPSGSIHIYGWRNPGPFSPNKSTLQFTRLEGYDFIDLAMIKLGNGGDQSVFALSIKGRWRWLQVAVFWPVEQFTLYASDTALTNIIAIDDAAAPLIIDDVAVTDDFTDGVVPVWDGGTGSIDPSTFKIKTAMPFKSGDGTDEYPDGGTGPINPTAYQFTDDSYAEFPQGQQDG